MSGPMAATATFAHVFTDAPIVPGTTVVRATHIAELRAAIDSLRMWRGLASVTWTDPVLTPGSSPIRAVHLLQLRSALDGVYTADGLAPPAWGPPPAAGTTVVAAAQLEEVRSRVRAVE